MTKNVVVKIYRKRWGMGSLRRQDNKKQCCLGFVACAAGLKPADILERGRLDDLVNREKIYSKFPMLLRKFEGISLHTPLADKLMEINDDEGFSMAEREDLLNKAAKKKGLSFKFVG